MTEHCFGGPWTEIKLDAVCYYLECYTKALAQRQFDLWYVDGFAGTPSGTVSLRPTALLRTSPGIRRTKYRFREPSRLIGRTTRNSIVAYRCYTVRQAQSFDKAYLIEGEGASKRMVPRKGLEPSRP
jgi:hypothetical protein